MRIYFSGNSSRDAVPEALIMEKRPDVMLTYHDFYKGSNDTDRRFNLHKVNVKKKQAAKAASDNKKPTRHANKS